MLAYVIRRLLLLVPTLIGVTAVVFFVMAFSPGGVGGGQLRNLEGETDASKLRAMKEYYNRRYGLDQPRIVQYGRWLNMVSPLGFATRDNGALIWGLPHFKTPDLGRSFSKGRSVTDLYIEALPITLTLNLITVPLVYGVSIMAGIYAARFKGKWFDMASGVTFLAAWSIPTIWAGVMLIGFLANREYLRMFPAGGLNSTAAMDMAFLPSWGTQGWQQGWLLDRLWHLMLPILCMLYGGFAFLSKLTRSAMLENLPADYVRTARAKGVGSQQVLFQHVFRNSLLPLITVAAGILPGLLAGSVIIETIFSIPGMGLLTIEAIRARDRELVLAGVLVGGIIGLICRLAADLAYAIADPRVSYE